MLLFAANTPMIALANEVQHATSTKPSASIQGRCHAISTRQAGRPSRVANIANPEKMDAVPLESFRKMTVNVSHVQNYQELVECGA